MEIFFFSFRLECEILAQLMKAHVEIQNWKFLPSLMALYGAQARMSAWERTLQNKEVSKKEFENFVSFFFSIAAYTF